MKCEERHNLLIDYALGQLDPTAEVELQAHLDSGCVLCKNELAEIEVTWASLAISLEPVEIPSEVEERILSRVRSSIKPKASSQQITSHSNNRVEYRSHHSPARDQPSVMLFVLAASLLGIATSVVCWQVLAPTNNLSDDSNTEQYAWGDPAINGHPTGFRTVGLRPLTHREGLTLSIVRNELVSQWHLLISGIPPVGSESSLQLWAELKSGKYLPLATLSISQTNTASALIDLPGESTEFVGLWLTLEDSDKSELPGEEVFFHGILQ